MLLQLLLKQPEPAMLPIYQLFFELVPAFHQPVLLNQLIFEVMNFHLNLLF